jgi:hypothetical protein
VNKRIQSIDTILLDELQIHNESGHWRFVPHLEYPDGWDFVVRDLRSDRGERHLLWVDLDTTEAELRAEARGLLSELLKLGIVVSNRSDPC